jgi:hypothetical protein
MHRAGSASLARDMELELLLLADGATSRPDGKLDIYGAGFDTLFASAVPTTHPQLAVILKLRLERHELESPHRLGILVMGPDEEVARLDGAMEEVPEEQRAQVPPGRSAAVPFVFNLANLTFPVFGDYAVAVTWDGTEIRRMVASQFPGEIARA